MAFAGQPLEGAHLDFWRTVIRGFRHQGGDPTASHPYQVLLRLVARKPGVTRAKCALVLEARDDSAEELERIVALADLPEEEILKRIDVSQANWDNAKKVIPRFAEQLGDVIKTGQSYRPAAAPGRGVGGIEELPQAPEHIAAAARRPRLSRAVTAETIGAAGIGERDEPAVPTDLDPEAAAEAKRRRADRLRRHNLLVREFAARLKPHGMTFFEDPFDVLAVLGRVGILGEIKTLDGSEEDERERVRDSLAQLLYYEAFPKTPVAECATINKVACFERPITQDHQRWLNRLGIATIWMADGTFAGDALAVAVLGRFVEELR